MPSSQKALKGKITDLEAKIATLSAENLTLLMQVDQQDKILSYYNGSCEEMGKLIDDMQGGMVARLKRILGRHGIEFKPDREGLQ